MNFFKVIFVLLLTSQYVISQGDNCLSFDGNNDYVFIGDVNNLGTSDFTIESWVYIENTAGNGNKIINKGLTSVGIPSNAGYGLRASKTGDDEIEFQIAHSDGNYKRVIYNGITTNQWYHVAGVRDRTKLYLYLNGVLVGEDSTSTIYNVDTNIPLVIGAIHKNGITPTNEFMHGKIDEVRVWNVARSVTEINDHMNCAITSPQFNLIAIYNLNETNNITASDSSGHANHGTLTNGPVWVNSTVAPICLNNLGKVSQVLIIYPNPFKDEIFIKNELNADFRIYSITGSLVLSGYIIDNKIEVPHLSKGSYILEISDGILVRRIKIMKE